ncbi:MULTISPECIES: sigma-70 family RNA polymerase sigma factor [unclassified Pseudomonas]|uniref:sigma-70 family RNA polymerase sigma factor n=1 Tax=unclassified Pseudomonas TaxID=196821 RepID=UPI002174FA23|nr:sigma-70 family RNA polymerase sigma factor [Pseudomonas sp. 29A]
MISIKSVATIPPPTPAKQATQRKEALHVTLDLSTNSLGDVFIAHRAKLRSIAIKIVGKFELADEVIQEAYLKVTVGLRATLIDKPYSYCCQVVRNLALDYYRRYTVESTYRVHVENIELPHPYDETPPEQILHDRRILEAIDNALKVLPKRTRTAFEMHRLAGFTQREIALKLGCSATLVNFMLKDAAVVVAPFNDMMEGR